MSYKTDIWCRIIVTLKLVPRPVYQVIAYVLCVGLWLTAIDIRWWISVVPDIKLRRFTCWWRVDYLLKVKKIQKNWTSICPT